MSYHSEPLPEFPIDNDAESILWHELMSDEFHNSIPDISTAMGQTSIDPEGARNIVEGVGSWNKCWTPPEPCDPSALFDLPFEIDNGSYPAMESIEDPFQPLQTQAAEIIHQNSFPQLLDGLGITMEDSVSAPQPGDGHYLKTKSEKIRHQFTPEVRKILVDYYEATPYPSSAEVDALASTTGETVKRITTWFGNTRTRHKSPSEF